MRRVAAAMLPLVLLQFTLKEALLHEIKEFNNLRVCYRCNSYTLECLKYSTLSYFTNTTNENILRYTTVN